MRRFFATLLLVLPALVAQAQDAPFPPGTSSHELHGLKCSVVMPPEFDPAVERSLVVILHGAGGSETGMAGALQFLAAQDYVVLAPKSRGDVWEKQDLDDVKAIVAELKPKLRIGATRLHGVGFSNGGWNLAPVAFDEELHFTSATWVAAGFNGGSPPKHAKKGMGVLAMAGAQDANRPHAEATPGRLEGDVRSGECRIQPNLGHEWPRELMPYFGYWLGVQEGRFVPGETLAFEWTEHTDPAVAPPAKGESGSFVYFWSAGTKDDEDAQAFQNEALHDALVHHYGDQLTAVKLDAEAEGAAAFLAAQRIKTLPAVVVYDTKGKVKKVLQGEIKAKALAGALKTVADNKKKPDK